MATAARTIFRLPTARLIACLLSIAVGGHAAAARAEAPRVLPPDKLPDDQRLGKLTDLDSYFPFTPSESPEAWAGRAEYVRRQMRVACGLWPMLPRGAIDATVHGKVERDDYTVEKVYFESFPGLYVTGNLYRPKKLSGKMPGILCPHGHWPNGRFHDHGEKRVREEIEIGAEKFETGGRHPIQARCVQLARMGCIVFHYDMLGYADSVPITFQVAHRFAKQRPELSKPDRWGLFSAQAELRLINVMGLQTFNSIRALDWLESLPHVDPERLGVTGASGGGTQTFMLTAIDERIDAAFPAVMVSTAMQGGCTCENACYLRIDTGNIEFAALAAPRPLGLSAADDWTKQLEDKGLPELRQHYEMLGVPERVEGKYFPFKHNYNYVSRAMMYEFFNEHFDLGFESPIVEKNYEPLTTGQMTVWNEEHPKPASDEEAEVALMKRLAEASREQIEAIRPNDKESLAEYRRVAGGALDVMIGRRLPKAAGIEYEQVGEAEHDGYREYTSLLRLPEHGEELPAIFLYPDDWNHQVVIWIHEDGKSGLYTEGGKLQPAVEYLVAGGAAVAGVDLLYQGEFLKEGETHDETRSVSNPREFLGYTLGYNHPLFARRVHDILTMIAYSKNHESQPDRVDVIGFGEAAPWVAAACIQAGEAVRKVAVDTEGFRFASITDVRHPQLWPGAVKYGDVPFLLALCAPRPLWLAGEGDKAPEVAAAAYDANGAKKKLHRFAGKPPERPMAAARWIMK